MKIKYIAAVASALVAGLSFAESSVTIGGVVDVGVRYDTNADGRGNKATSMTSDGLSSSRLAIGVKEDVGNGLKATVNLEIGFGLSDGRQDGLSGNNNTKGIKRILNRRGTVGLAGDFGSVDLGRQATLSNNIVSLYDPTGMAGFGQAYERDGVIPPSHLIRMRRDNMIYFKGNFNTPVTLHAAYAFGQVPGGGSRGSHWGAGLSYGGEIGGGNLQLGAGFTRDVTGGNQVASGKQCDDKTTVGEICGLFAGWKFANPASLRYNDDTATIGGSYGYGPVTGSLGYIYRKTAGQSLVAPAKVGDTGSYKQNSIFGGLTYAATQELKLTLAYYHHKFKAQGTSGTGTYTADGKLGANVDGKANVIVFISDYNLSKRTSMYFAYDLTSIKNDINGLRNEYMPTAKAFSDDTKGAKNNRSGYSIGIRHKF